MKFDFIIGNPPYQDETVGDQKSFAPPVYHKFMDASYRVGDRVCLVTPARFLFRAGGTPARWNDRMLADPHLKVLLYSQKSSDFFPDTDIKGGVAVTYRDRGRNFGPIGTFTSFPLLNDILHKVIYRKDFKSFGKIVKSRTEYRFTDKMHAEHPEASSLQSKGHPYDMSTNVLDVFENMLFFENPPKLNGGGYIKMYGLLKGKRTYMWIKADYVNRPENFSKYKVFVPQANGSGALGEVLSTPLIGTPLIGTPLIGHTETFLSIGCFDTRREAEACLKYVKTKFARTMLGVLKVTQSNPPDKWKYVPLQDFTPDSDIDWTKSVGEIDRFLYAKYGLSPDEIRFIEEKVKEME